jgi:hypothetical protein
MSVQAPRGRSLLNDPAFLALARAYEETVVLPRRATVRDVTEGHWYALVLAPGRERDAIDRVADETWLPAYVPIVRELRLGSRGHPFAIRRALFTGYGFVLVADIDAFFSRIKSCDGVLGIMCDDGQPAIIRSSALMRFDHGLIEYIRALEHGENSWLLEQFNRKVVQISPGRRRKRRRRKSKRACGREKASASPLPMTAA